MSVTRVLIVEDEPGLREGLASAIGTLGHEALSAAGITEARKLIGDDLDCVLLDIRLKDGDGLDFLKELREGPQHDVPVIVATAYGTGTSSPAAAAIEPISEPMLKVLATATNTTAPTSTGWANRSRSRAARPLPVTRLTSTPTSESS